MELFKKKITTRKNMVDEADNIFIRPVCMMSFIQTEYLINK